MTDHRSTPSAEVLLALHARVVRGDPVALDELADRVLPVLRRALRRSLHRADTDEIAESAHQAILIYRARPNVFEPGRGIPLDRFLLGIAANLLRVRLRSDARRSVREGEWAERLRQSAAPHRDGPALRVAIREVRQALPLVCNPSDLAAMSAWLDEDDSGAVAVQLGVAHLPSSAQRRAQTRLLARVARKLKRYFESLRGGGG